MWRNLPTLIGLEWRLEFRQRASLAGVLLFAVGSVYVYSLAFGRLEPQLWNALYWVILLFGATNGLAGSYVRELQDRHLYYSQLTPPLPLFFAKLIVNACFLVALGLLVWGLLALLFGSPVRDILLFSGTLVLASTGLSVVLTFLALVAGRVRTGGGLVAVLAFPVVLPLLLTVIKLGAVSTRVITQLSTDRDLLVLVGINLAAIGLSMLLVPLLWRDA